MGLWRAEFHLGHFLPATQVAGMVPDRPSGGAVWRAEFHLGHFLPATQVAGMVPGPPSGGAALEGRVPPRPFPAGSSSGRDGPRPSMGRGFGGPSSTSAISCRQLKCPGWSPPLHQAPWRCNAHATCSRTSAEGWCRRLLRASITGMLVWALPSPTARLRSQRS